MQIFVLIIIVSISDAKDCLKNEDIGHRTGNVYQCNDPQLTVCCEMEGTFTCCEPAYNKNLREQLQLWVCVTLIVLVIVIMYVYMRKDVQIFASATVKEGFTDLKSKFSSRYSKKETKGFEHGIEDDPTIPEKVGPVQQPGISNCRNNNKDSSTI